MKAFHVRAFLATLMTGLLAWLVAALCVRGLAMLFHNRISFGVALMWPGVGLAVYTLLLAAVRQAWESAE